MKAIDYEEEAEIINTDLRSLFKIVVSWRGSGYEQSWVGAT